MQRYDAIILGAGISGMISASVLIEKGFKKILMIDEYSQLGGNHISVDIGPYSFDIGSFIFHDNSPFLKRFPKALGQYLPFDGATGRIDTSGRLANYPFDLRADLVAPGPVEWGQILLSVMKGRLTRRPEKNAHEFVSYWLGERLASRTGLLTYLRRFYGTDPDTIEGEFARKRMRWVSTNASLKGQIQRLIRPQGVRNRSLVRPRLGFAALYEPVGQALQEMGVEIALGQDIQSVTRMADGSLAVTTADFSAASPAVCSTVPVDICARWCGLTVAPTLRYATLTSLFYSFKGQRSFAQHVLYNFSATGRWKRLTMHSDCYGTAGGREYFSVEAIATDAEDNIAEFDADFCAHAKQSGIFAGDLTLEGSRITTSAYPIYLQGAGADADRLIKALKAFGILSFGRQGGFDYQPTAHVSAVTAERTLGELSASP